MASLPELEQVTQLSPYVTRILGENPGKFTLQGTNSYLVHHPSSTDLLLIDTTGPSSSSPLPPASLSVYTTSLLRALSSHPVQPARVSDILLTHWHGDHVDALPAVLDALPHAEGARVWKVPCAEGPAWDGEEGKDAAIEQSLAGALAEGRIQPAEDGRAVRPLQDGQRFVLAPPPGAEGADAQAEVEVEVVHTPGHTSDSICLLLHRASSTAPLALFTADTILGHGSSVFASLSAYMSSLSTLLSRLRSSAEGEVALYPGHGAPVADARAKVAEYAAHRTEREGQVIAALRERGRGGEATTTTTAGELTEQIYGSTIPASLIPAATHGLLLHLAKLQEEGRVVRVPASAEVVAAGDSRAPPGWWDGWRWVEGVKEDSPGRL